MHYTTIAYGVQQPVFCLRPKVLQVTCSIAARNSLHTQNGVDYMELAKENSNHTSINQEFFNFNDYGWFQFSCVKHSIEQNKSLEEVLKEMGFENVQLTEKMILEHKTIDEEESTAIIDEAVKNFNEWGLTFPVAYQMFNNDPNNNYSSPSKNFLWLIKKS